MGSSPKNENGYNLLTLIVTYLYEFLSSAEHKQYFVEYL